MYPLFNTGTPYITPAEVSDMRNPNVYAMKPCTNALTIIVIFVIIVVVIIVIVVVIIIIIITTTTSIIIILFSLYARHAVHHNGGKRGRAGFLRLCRAVRPTAEHQGSRSPVH